jgi:hypothetical protein
MRFRGSSASSTWTDPPGPVPRVLRPGFTFSEKPRWADGPLGAVTVLAMTCAVGLAWRRLGHSPGAQRAALAAVLGWVAFVVVIVWRIPDNAAWNHQWEELVRGQSVGALEVAFPKGVEDAASFVSAVRALDRASVLQLASSQRETPR